MKDKLLQTIRKSMAYTLSVAEAMPEEFYTSQITPVNYNFAEMLSHIAYGIGWCQEALVEEKQTQWDEPDAKTSKSEIIAMLKEAFKALMDIVSKMVMSDHVIYGCCATLEHITHHRAQAILFLRKQGVTPPEYVF